MENTYLGTFQTLGGLGLLLGTLGLSVVLLRNLLERRGELATMQAIGFWRQALAWLVVAENGLVLTAGVAVGAASALVAVSPHLLGGHALVPWLSLGLTLLLVMAAGNPGQPRRGAARDPGGTTPGAPGELADHYGWQPAGNPAGALGGPAVNNACARQRAHALNAVASLIAGAGRPGSFRYSFAVPVTVSVTRIV